jgi:hypothetical protein
MLGPGVFLLRVRIPAAIVVTKVDTAWFDAYLARPQPEYIENYWRSVPYSKAVPTWEYLVEGVIEADDPKALKYLREHGARPE